MRFLLLLALSMIVSGAITTVAEPSKGRALLIGNYQYGEAVGPLRNPGNDVERVKEALVRVGYQEHEITVLKNASRVEILSAVVGLSDDAIELGDDQTVFFYYSGWSAPPRWSTVFVSPAVST